MNDCEPQNRLPIGKVSFLVNGGYQNSNSFRSGGYGELGSIPLLDHGTFDHCEKVAA